MEKIKIRKKKCRHHLGLGRERVSSPVTQLPTHDQHQVINYLQDSSISSHITPPSPSPTSFPTHHSLHPIHPPPHLPSRTSSPSASFLPLPPRGYKGHRRHSEVQCSLSSTRRRRAVSGYVKLLDLHFIFFGVLEFPVEVYEWVVKNVFPKLLQDSHL